MAEYIEVNGPLRISGEVQISGAKNAALPVLMATFGAEPSACECSEY
jgi:UDP-N-acetylglucosamine enolpyruvyl transferase